MEPIATLNDRHILLRRAIVFLCISIGWTFVEAVCGTIAAANGKSIALSAFSMDSGVELLSGIVVLSRMWREAQVGEGAESRRLERFSAAVVGCCLLLLAAIISLKAGQSFALRTSPALNGLGLAVAGLSSVIMPWLFVQKRSIGRKLHSHALLGDAACGLTCAYMAWTLLIGMVVQHVFGWWWTDAVAALGILYFVLREGFESLESARTGEGHHHHHH